MPLPTALTPLQMELVGLLLSPSEGGAAGVSILRVHRVWGAARCCQCTLHSHFGAGYG